MPIDAVKSFYKANRYRIKKKKKELGMDEDTQLTTEQLKKLLQDKIYVEMKFDIKDDLEKYMMTKAKSPKVKRNENIGDYDKNSKVQKLTSKMRRATLALSAMKINIEGRLRRN